MQIYDVVVKKPATGESETLRVQAHSPEGAKTVAMMHTKLVFRGALAEYEVTEVEEYYATKFWLDSCAETPVPGYTIGESWNGWACPRFEKDAVVNVMEQFAAFNLSAGWIPTRWEYDAAADTFLVWESEDEADPPYKYPGFDITLPDGQVKHVYALGAWNWTWDEYDEEEDDAAH